MPYTNPGRLVILAFVAVASGCSDSPADPRGSQSPELAQVLQQMSLPAVAGAVGAFAPVSMPALAAAVPSQCVHESASGSFVCPPVNFSGITVSRSFTLFDAAGASQSSFVPTTTAAVRTHTTARGTLTGGAMSLVLDEEDTMTLSGLLTSANTLDGVSNARMSGSYGSGSSTLPFTMTTATTIARVVLPKPSGGERSYPMSGTVTVDNTTTTSTLAPTSTRLVMTFNGTSVVDVVMTSFGVTRHCTVDLARSSLYSCS